MEKGYVHIYHGDGKGKTTSAVGLSIRALGAGYQVIFAQFLKGGVTSELSILSKLNNVTIIRCDKDYKFTWLLSESEKMELKEDHNQLWERIIEAVELSSGQCLLVLDELCATYDLNLIDKREVMDFLNHKPEQLEVVITGRNPAKEMLEIADYISEIKKEKHPMDNGIYARLGIEM